MILFVVVFLASFASAEYVQKTNATLRVPSQLPWMSTGVVLEKGDELSIAAYGMWMYDPRPQYETTADGVFRGGPGTLRGMIGAGQPFIVGSYYSKVVDEEGQLFLGMVECDYPDCYRDNYGELSANIVVNRKEKPKVEEKKNETIAAPETTVNETTFNPPEKTTEQQPIIEAGTKTCNLFGVFGVLAVIALLFLPKESSGK